MGLFGSDDADESEESTGADTGRGATDEAGSRISERADRILEAADSRGELEGLLSELDGDGRTGAARTFGRVLVADPAAPGEDTVESAIKALAERERARAIAEGLLHGAEGLRRNGIEAGTVAEGALDALAAALSAIGMIRSGGAVPGGGAGEVALAGRLREEADAVGGTDQLVYEATADAFERSPSLLAKRAGMDPIDTLVEMRVGRQRGESIGVDVESGTLDSPGSIAPETLRRLLVDGVVLVVVVLVDRGTASQLETQAGIPVRG